MLCDEWHQTLRPRVYNQLTHLVTLSLPPEHSWNESVICGLVKVNQLYTMFFVNVSAGAVHHSHIFKTVLYLTIVVVGELNGRDREVPRYLKDCFVFNDCRCR